jgi:hypothetical protein
VSEWQTIESAPKDGTELMLWDLDGFAVLGQYVSFDGKAPSGYHDGWYDSWRGYDELTPSHWMPLPSPPEPPK